VVVTTLDTNFTIAVARGQIVALRSDNGTEIVRDYIAGFGIVGYLLDLRAAVSASASTLVSSVGAGQ
jgi:hypothetical protein